MNKEIQYKIMQLLKIENFISSCLSFYSQVYVNSLRRVKICITDKNEEKDDGIDKNYCTIKLILLLMLFKTLISSNISDNISDKQITQHL